MRITFPQAYCQHIYWIEGTPPQAAGSNGAYFYFIQRPGSAPDEAIASNETFTRVLECNAAARSAIELLAGTANKPTPKPQVLDLPAEAEEPKPKRRRKAS